MCKINEMIKNILISIEINDYYFFFLWKFKYYNDLKNNKKNKIIVMIKRYLFIKKVFIKTIFRYFT